MVSGVVSDAERAKRGHSSPEGGDALRINQLHVDGRVNINTLGLVASAALARMLAITLDFLPSTCLTGTPNPLALVHCGERAEYFCNRPRRVRGELGKKMFYGGARKRQF